MEAAARDVAHLPNNPPYLADQEAGCVGVADETEGVMIACDDCVADVAETDGGTAHPTAAVTAVGAAAGSQHPA